MTRNKWTVRKSVRALVPGDKFVYTQELGGDDETVTVAQVYDAGYGLYDISVWEQEATIVLLHSQFVTLA